MGSGILIRRASARVHRWFRRLRGLSRRRLPARQPPEPARLSGRAVPVRRRASPGHRGFPGASVASDALVSRHSLLEALGLRRSRVHAGGRGRARAGSSGAAFAARLGAGGGDGRSAPDDGLVCRGAMPPGRGREAISLAGSRPRSPELRSLAGWAFFGGTIVWRGERFRLERGGRLVPFRLELAPADDSAPAQAAR